MPETGRGARMGVRLWLLALLPLLLLAGLIAVLVRSGPAEALRGEGAPPVERLTFQRVTLGSEGIVARILNDGPDAVTIAQVQVDEAYWQFSAEPTSTLGHLDAATLTIPYPWVEGEAHVVTVLTGTGATFEHEIAVAVRTPTAGWNYLGLFALIGLYVGVIPVAIGLLWYPVVARLGIRGMEFVLALTVGLLLFLAVDALAEGFETAALLPESFQGSVLFAFSALAAFLGLDLIGARLRRGSSRERHPGWVLALLVAVGIGLHNFGEGLAIGAAFSLGEAALGTLLIVGFSLHNTTEGVAIVAPLARQAEPGTPVPLSALARLGLIGGLPTVAGAWLGGFVYSPVLALTCLGLGVGAIVQVTVQILGQMAPEASARRVFARGPVLSGLLAGFVMMYMTGMMIG